jgi:hypothetical protein
MYKVSVLWKTKTKEIQFEIEVHTRWIRWGKFMTRGESSGEGKHSVPGLNKKQEKDFGPVRTQHV